MAERINSADILKEQRRKDHIQRYYREKARLNLEAARAELDQACERLSNTWLDYQAAHEKMQREL
jgi:hypothetical protein